MCMFYRLREAMARFMAGRYGWDTFGFALWVLYMVLWFINLFLQSLIIRVLMLAALFYELFRLFSKNTYARRRENQWFETVWYKVKRVFSRRRDYYTPPKPKRERADREHIFRTCPKCKANLRLPRKRGRHIARCPACDERFKVWVLF